MSVGKYIAGALGQECGQRTLLVGECLVKNKKVKHIFYEF